MHEGAEVTEKFGELACVLLIASMVTFVGLETPGLGCWLLVAALLIGIRPLAVGVSFLGSRLQLRERLFVGWFGVRGIGSLYYAAVAVGSGYLSGAEAEIVAWTAIAAVLVSILVHGITASPLSRRWLPPEAQNSAVARRDN